MYQDIIRDPGGAQVVRLVSSATIVNGSILLVPADTVAFFVLNGHVSEPYVSGRYEIRTGVSPFFVRFRNLMTRGEPGITCQVWYINTCQEICKSGGTGDLVFREQRFHLSMKARASYTLRYVISDPLAFISKLVGMHNNDFDNEDIQPAIDSMIQPFIKQSIIRAISGHEVHAFQNELVAMGNEIRAGLCEELRTYGINLRAVAITAVNIPDEEFKRLAKLEEKYADGTVATDIEVDNVRRVYGSLDNRTFVEALTGGIRGNGTPIPRETNGIAGMMATFPLQMSLAGQMMEQMSGALNNMMGNANSSAYSSQNGTGGASTTGVVPPDLPVRRRTCPNCSRELDNTDTFCRYCGNRL